LTAAEEGSSKAAASDVKFLDLSREKRVLEATVNSLIVQKNKMEDELYRAFAKCINAKKDKIKLLLDAGGNPCRRGGGEKLE